MGSVCWDGCARRWFGILQFAGCRYEVQCAAHLQCIRKYIKYYSVYKNSILSWATEPGICMQCCAQYAEYNFASAPLRQLLQHSFPENSWRLRTYHNLLTLPTFVKISTLPIQFYILVYTR